MSAFSPTPLTDKVAVRIRVVGGCRQYGQNWPGWCVTSVLPTTHTLSCGHVNSSEEASSGNQPRSPQVIVSFSGYEPPFDPAPLVRRMLDSVPKNYLAGLDAVVLSNASGLSGKRRNSRVKSRKRKMGLAAASGLYHPACRDNLAWIEIFG